MHRVELKDGDGVKVLGFYFHVPNAPCGVESPFQDGVLKLRLERS